jgi:hypothetical protein
MATMKSSRKAVPTFAGVRASLRRLQTQGERVAARLRRDANALVVRSRGEVAREVRAVERRILKAFHAATEEKVARLERRIVKLEQTVAELRRPTKEEAA